MGITGLIPFLEKSSRKTNISEFSGGTVAIDTYCWLHKGAFACADKIIMKQPTDVYIKYCMKYVNMLLENKIKPILVFDGRHLPAKAETEVKRRESRDSNRKRAADLIKMGKFFEGKNLLRRSLDVSHKMALEVMKECQAINIDCIVAPYEADAQLAYLNISGIADVVITEDSDLTLFGCKKILFKMDLNGDGILVEQERLHLAMGLKLSDFNIDKFRYMCILSGCDYLPSLPGIGLVKACKFVVKNTDSNIYNALVRLPSTLNKKSLIVTKEYRDSFMCALVTFKHQLVFCPILREQVRLNEITPDVTSEQLHHAGTEVEPELALQLALGNCDPFSFEKLHNFNPDQPRLRRTNSWNENTVSRHVSIWSPNFQVKKVKESKPILSEKITPEKEKQPPMRTPSTRGQVLVMKTEALKNQITPKKRSFEESEKSVEDILSIYRVAKKESNSISSPQPEPDVSSDEANSPRILRRKNPFRKTNDTVNTSPNLLERPRRCILPVKSRMRSTVINDAQVEESKFFSPKPSEDKKEDEGFTESMDIVESMVTHVSQEESKENFVHHQEREIIPETEDYDHNIERVIIPETEDFENETPQTQESVDSGFKEPSSIVSTPKKARSEPTSEKIPLQTIDKNSPENRNFNSKNIKKVVEEKELKVDLEKINLGDDLISLQNVKDHKLEFSISQQAFSESKSSLFNYETPDKKFKRDESVPENKKNKISQKSSNNTPKSKSKKTQKIQRQQSLLNMFGFQKKDVANL